MKIGKILIFTLLLAAVTASAEAQKIENVRNRLQTPETGVNGRPAQVHVNESGKAGDAVRRGEATLNQQSANGFRVVVFFDNGISARSEAERIKAELSETFPDMSCDIRYENPYFKLLAGNCRTSEEAVILLGRIRSSYPEAYIMREDIPLQNFITPKPEENSGLNGNAEAAE